MSVNAILARVCLLMVLGASALRAQAPAYGRDPADTLRYRERVETEVRSAWMASRGVMTQESRIALTFARGDTVRAWYEELAAESKQANFHSRLNAPGHEIRGAFTLVVSPSGRVRIVSVPTFPAPLDMEFDSLFAWQFVDFLPVLPAEPLRPGLEWADSGTANPAHGRFARATRYRVTGDTVVNGVRAVIVETESRLTVRRGGMVDEEYAVRTDLEGTERGRFIFAPGPGLLLRRERRGTLRGTETSLLDGEQASSAWQSREYTSTLELLSPPRE